MFQYFLADITSSEDNTLRDSLPRDDAHKDNGGDFEEPDERVGLSADDCVAEVRNVLQLSASHTLRKVTRVNYSNTRIATITTARRTGTSLLELWNTENGELLWSYARKLDHYPGIQTGILADFSPDGTRFGFYDNSSEINPISLMDVSRPTITNIGALRCPSDFRGAEAIATHPSQQSVALASVKNRVGFMDIIIVNQKNGALVPNETCDARFFWRLDNIKSEAGLNFSMNGSVIFVAAYVLSSPNLTPRPTVSINCFDVATGKNLPAIERAAAARLLRRTGHAWLLQGLFNYEDGTEGILVDQISQTTSSETRVGPQQASNKIRTLMALFRDGRSILLWESHDLGSSQNRIFLANGRIMGVNSTRQVVTVFDWKTRDFTPVLQLDKPQFRNYAHFAAVALTKDGITCFGHNREFHFVKGDIVGSGEDQE